MLPATRHKWTHPALTPASWYSIYLPRRDGRPSWPMLPGNAPSPTPYNHYSNTTDPHRRDKVIAKDRTTPQMLRTASLWVFRRHTKSWADVNISQSIVQRRVSCVMRYLMFALLLSAPVKFIWKRDQYLMNLRDNTLNTARRLTFYGPPCTSLWKKRWSRLCVCMRVCVVKPKFHYADFPEISPSVEVSGLPSKKR